MTGSPAATLEPGAVTARIRSLKPALLPAERQVAQVLLDQAALLEQTADVVDLSSQQVAELAGTSRATVVRACQSLGFTGFQQVRVLLARDAALARSARRPPASERSPVTAALVDRFEQIAGAASTMTSMMTDETVERAVDELARAEQILVTANGLSLPLAIDAVARLTRIGLHAGYHSDLLQQLVAARLLEPGDVAWVISASGAHADSLKVARAARSAGATVLALTAFARSPLARLADVTLVVGIPGSGFTDELTEPTRVPQMILLEGMTAALRVRLGKRADRAEALALEIVSGHVDE